MAGPHISTVIKDYVTAAAIVLGGAWALWRWTYGEILRRRREMASPDGTLSVGSVEIAMDLVAVTVNALWRNRGPLLIALCSEHSDLKVYRLASSLSEGPLSIHEPTISQLVAKVSPWWDTYVMEPNTESLLQEHIALRRGYVYAFRWRICLSPGSLPGHLAKDHLSCRRDLIWQAPVAYEANVVAQANAGMSLQQDLVSPGANISSST
jgi:hypothetical protein